MSLAPAAELGLLHTCLYHTRARFVLPVPVSELVPFPEHEIKMKLRIASKRVAQTIWQGCRSALVLQALLLGTRSRGRCSGLGLQSCLVTASYSSAGRDRHHLASPSLGAGCWSRSWVSASRRTSLQFCSGGARSFSASNTLCLNDVRTASASKVK